MSSNLYWRPVSSGQKPLSDELKHALHRLDKFNNTIHQEFNESDTAILRGMEAAGIVDAGKLIKAIEKYGTVEVNEEY